MSAKKAGEGRGPQSAPGAPRKDRITLRHLATPAYPDKALLRRAYLGDLLAARRKDALERIMAAFHDGCPIPDLYLDVFQEALYEIGRLWETNRISVADEHIATTITQFIMSNLYQHLEVAETRRGRLVVVGIQGEMHQVGANMVSDVLEADGWEVLFLGANVPPEDVVAAVRKQGADLLGISATLAANLPRVVELAGRVGRELGDRAPGILLGGGAFRGVRPLPEGLEGALLARDLREALDLTRSLVPKEGAR